MSLVILFICILKTTFVRVHSEIVSPLYAFLGRCLYSHLHIMSHRKGTLPINVCILCL